MASPQVNGVSDVNGVNGVRPSSAFIDHLLQYPVVADSVASVQHTKYGQQTLALGASAYATLARTIEPLLATPYGYVAPYVVPVVHRADALGDRTLGALDSRVVPTVTAVYADAKGRVLAPVRHGLAGRDHVAAVYAGERKQIPGAGVLPLGKALAATALVVTGETLAWVREHLTAAAEHQKHHHTDGGAKVPNGTK